MKRILSVLLIVLVFLSLFGCAGETAETAENKATAETKENLEPNPPEDFEYHLMKDGDAVTITKYTGKDEYVVIPKQIEGKSVTAIAQNCFQNAKSFLKAVTLPDTIETIGRMAFSDCSFLSSINLPKSLSQIETCAFRNCISLKKVQILSNCLNKNSSEAFAYSGLETIILGEGVKYIPPLCFAGTKISKLELPYTVTEISNQAFAACNLEVIFLNEGLVTIGHKAFAANLNLEKITIPKTVSSITEMAFSGCSGLKEVYFEGNAPISYEYSDPISGTWEPINTNYTVYYHQNAEGFTSPEWYGYPTVMLP